MKKKTLFYHGKTIDGYRFTIAGQYSPLPKNSIDQDIDVIILGAALCTPEDQFVKKLGRQKAEGRMNSEVKFDGRSHHNLYDKTLPQNWFKGKELGIFLKLAKDYELMRSSEFKKSFHL